MIKTKSIFQPNTIYCGDNKDVLRHFEEKRVDLIYLDPPFFSNKHYEVIWNDGYELRAFEDRWKGGINNYIGWMEERLIECYKVLKDNGSIYLHCDWHAGHYLKVMMDRIFGQHNLRNEIIWHYESGGRAINFFPTKHDTIFFYSKSNDYYFDWQSVGIPRNKCQCCGEELESWNHMKKHIDKGGRIYRTIKSAGKVYKYYDDEPVPPTDVWNDISHIQQKDPERLGYPTQKPEKLLHRIISASSKPTDIVLDPFCGCGTAISVAHKLGRRWVGIDVSPTACKLMAKRMRSIGAKGFKEIGLPQTIGDLKKIQPFEFQNWVMEKLYARVSSKKTGDMGIDGYYIDGSPIQVKQSEDIGRNVVDNFESAIRRAGKNKGVIVAFSFGKGAHEEVAKVKLEQGLEITLKTVEEILKET